MVSTASAKELQICKSLGNLSIIRGQLINTRLERYEAKCTTKFRNLETTMMKTDARYLVYSFYETTQLRKGNVNFFIKYLAAKKRELTFTMRNEYEFSLLGFYRPFKC